MTFYEKWLKEKTKQGPTVLRRCARRYEEPLAQYAPAMLEEMEGIAKGARLTLDDVLLVNARTDLAVTAKATDDSASMPGCTAMALVSDNHDTLAVGQNWDWRAEAENSCLILKLHQKNKPDIIMHAEAGTIGHRGFNSAGMGVCINYIRCETDTFKLGLPFLVKLRAILNSTNLPDCLRLLLTFVGPTSMNMVIGHRGGEALDAENTPNDVLFLYPEGGILTHANHFQSPNLRVRDTGKSTLPDTIFRSNRALRLFNERRGRLGWDTIKEVLTDHFGHPNSICRHRDERYELIDQWETLCSIIMDLSEGKMLYTEGPPCSNSYRTISIKERS